MTQSNSSQNELFHETAPEKTPPEVPFHPLHAEHGPLKNLIDFNFLQYASYVICDRAIPSLKMGLNRCKDEFYMH